MSHALTLSTARRTAVALVAAVLTALTLIAATAPSGAGRPTLVAGMCDKVCTPGLSGVRGGQSAGQGTGKRAHTGPKSTR